MIKPSRAIRAIQQVQAVSESLHMLSPVSPHILLLLLPLDNCAFYLVLGLAPGPRKYFQRFFDMEVDPRAGGKTSRNHRPKSPPWGWDYGGHGGKTQMFWAGIEPWTLWSPMPTCV